MNFVYRRLLPYPERIATAATLLRIYQRSGLQTAARATGILKLLGLAERDLLLPPVDRQFFFDQLGNTFAAQGTRRPRVAFFAGSVPNLPFSALNEAPIRSLAPNDSPSASPPRQSCSATAPTLRNKIGWSHRMKPNLPRPPRSQKSPAM